MKAFASFVLLWLCLRVSVPSQTDDLPGHWLAGSTADGNTPTLLVFAGQNYPRTRSGTSCFGSVEFEDIDLESRQISFSEVRDLGIGRAALPPVKLKVPADVHIRWPDLGPASISEFRELRRQADLTTQERYSCHTTPPHRSALLRVAARKTLSIVFIGDSITEVHGSNAAPARAAEYLSEEAAVEHVEFSNQGYAGHTTVNFLPSQGSSFAAVEQAAARLRETNNGSLIFSAMLGTNDSAISGPLGSPVSPADYHKNMMTILDRLLKDFPGCKIILHRPIWYSPNTYNNARYLAEGLTRLQSYFPELDRIVEIYASSHPKQVFKGDTDAFQFFKKNHKSYLIPESGNQGTFYLHPNVEGAKVLGRFWAEATYRVMDEL